MTEQRRYPRVSVPVLVELKHASIGTLQVTADNLSAGGLFISFDAEYTSSGANPLRSSDLKEKLGRLQERARLKVRLLSAVAIEPQPTPTVDMVVARVDKEGLGLKFSNETSKFLWQSAPQRRTELDVGRDYFQVYLSLLITHNNRVLLLEQRGNWVFPGCYLQVGVAWRDAVKDLLEEQLGLSDCEAQGPVEFESLTEESLPQAATLRLFYRYDTDSTAVKLTEEQDYRDHRWIDRPRVLADLTFAQETDRDVATQLLTNLAATLTNDPVTPDDNPTQASTES